MLFTFECNLGLITLAREERADIFSAIDHISFCQSVRKLPLLLGEASLALLIECRTLDCKFAGSNLTRGAV